MSAAAQGPRALLTGRRVVASVGAGGVGKTTLAAALGLAAARLGRRALVLTIDPARRLADALGAGPLGAEPTAIPRERLAALGVPAGGSLSACMLDMKQTFDDLVHRFATTDTERRRILDNPIYRHVSDALAGSAEYAAMEKVYELASRPDVDVVILDTPPSSHALDFLEAPERLMGLLDSGLVQHLLHPAMQAGRFGLRLFQRGVHQAFRLVERVSGFGFLEDVSEFLLAFEGMSAGFRERARLVQGLLFGPQSAFLLGAAPSATSVAHACAFAERLRAAHAPMAGVVLNRLHTWPGAGAPPVPERERDAERAALAAAFERAGAARAEAVLAAGAAISLGDGYAAWVRRDAAETRPLVERAHASGWFVRRVPELPDEVHDLAALDWIAARLLCEDEDAD